MPVYVSDLFTATAAPVNAAPTSTRTWQWLRGSSAISGATSATYTAVTADIGSTLSATQLETNFLATTTATSAATEVVQAFDPIRLFSASEPGVWYDPSDMSTLFQNATGTIPVTSFGQPVGLMLDKSRGGAGPELVTNGDFSAGTTGWSGATNRITGGVLSFVGVSTLEEVAQTALTVGKTYKLTFTVSRFVAVGTFRIRLGGGGAGDISVPIAGNGTYTAISFAGVNTLLQFVAYANSNFDIDNISVKELPGLHATQSTDASRPLYGIVPVSGRRNLIIQTEDFSSASWQVAGSGGAAVGVKTPNFGIAPDGTQTACRVQLNVSAGSAGAQSQMYQTFAVSGTICQSAWVRTNDNSTVTISGFSAAGSTLTITGSWTRVQATAPTGGTFNFQVILVKGVTSDTADLLVWHPQSETGSTPTAYQRVSTDLDVTEAGVASVGYLRFDGSTSWMVTPTITPGTDKVQVFAGVRKLSDAAIGVVYEYSAISNDNNGSFKQIAPDNAAAATVSVSSRGTAANALDQAITTSGNAAPKTYISTATHDIAGDISNLRLNGVASGSATGDQGAGNYLSYPLYIGRRGGTLFPLNGHLFPLIVRFGPNLTAARIAATEAWVATKTAGVTL